MPRRWVQMVFFLVVVQPLLRVLLGVNVFGREQLPPAGPMILVANHNSHLDTLALMSLFPLRRLAEVRPVAAADYFLKHRGLRWLACDMLNIIPICRAGIGKDNNPLRDMSQAIEAGQSLIVFPEGSRGEPEHLQPFKTGVAHLILRHPHVPVVPVFLQGMGYSLPKGELMLLPMFVDVMVGAPRQYALEGKAAIVEALEKDIQALRQDLQAMWQEEPEFDPRDGGR